MNKYLTLDHDKSYLHAMQYSLMGKLMNGKRHIHRIYCYRCGKWNGHWQDPCLCLPIWTCMDGFQADLCKQQQCIYCVGATEWRPRRYPRIFNVEKPKHYPFPAPSNYMSPFGGQRESPTQ